MVVWYKNQPNAGISIFIIILFLIILILLIISLINTNQSDESTTTLVSTNYINIDPSHLSELIKENAIISRGTNIVDISNEIYNTTQNNPLGFYNISVRKTSDGYSGVIRASSWNGCFNINVTPAFSHIYWIQISNEGSILNLSRIDINYDQFNNCTEHTSDVYANGLEDPRIFTFRNEDWIIANSLGHPLQRYPCVNTMCLFKLSDPINTFRLLQPPNGTSLNQRQKNWSPFEYNGELYCEYGIDPHIILNINVNTGSTKEIYQTGFSLIDIKSDTSLRGGAPPILINNLSNPYFPQIFYLGIGHKRTKSNSDYVHFIYAFEAIPPFKILKITSSFKLDGNERIQFVAGLSYYDDEIYVSYGVDDCFNRISRIHINDILNILSEDQVTIT